MQHNSEDPHFNEMCDRYYKWLYLYIESKTCPGWLYAEDIVQETLIKASDFWHELRTRDEEVLRGWLYRVARNQLTDHYRREKHRSSVWDSLDKVVLGQTEGPDLFQDIEDILRALKQLSPKEYACICLLIDGYRTKEISEILQIEPGGVRAHITRARKKFKKIYRDM